MWPESSEQPAPLRTGYSTGCCATVCAVAATEWLLTSRQPSEVSIILPKGQQVTFPVVDYGKRNQTCASASVIKDAGDDPDITHGARIRTQIELVARTGVEFHGGEGVGTVTRAGLALAIGEPAINPVPRRMIVEHLKKLAAAYHYEGGFRVTISIDNGAELAKKTMNPRLGIMGGLSVLGTTGIVRPFSCAAYIASIHQGIDVALSNGISHIAAATGNLSEQAIARHYQLPDMALIEMGDFVGAVLKYIRNKPVAKLSLCGGFGKITKMASGHMDLHSRAGAVDFGHLAQWAQEVGANPATQQQIIQANTSIEAYNIALDQRIPLALRVCEQALVVAQKKVPGLDIEVWAVDRQGQMIAVARDQNP